MRDSTPSRGEQLITRFLGPDAAVDGPFGLLGLEPSACTPSAVETALERQLERVAHHPEAETPQADAVRLALDTAASELLDPITRAQWIAEYRTGEVPFTEPEPTSEPTPERTQIAERESRPILQPTEHAQDADDGGDSMVKRMLLVVGVGLGVMLLGLGIGVWMLSAAGVGGPTAPVAPTPTTSATTTPTAPVVPPQIAESVPADPPPPPLAPLRIRGRSEFTDGPTVRRELDLAAREMSADPARALSRFENAFAVAADWWARYPANEQIGAADRIIECVHRVRSHPDHAVTLLRLIAEPSLALAASDRPLTADEVWPAVWSVEMLARLVRASELPPQIRASISRSLDDAIGRGRSRADPTGRLAQNAALRLIPPAILAGRPPSSDDAADARVQARDALKRWIECVKLAHAGGPVQIERHLADALAWTLIEAPDPDRDVRVFEAITTLGGEIAWREGGPARPRLMDWFRNRRVSDTDLRILTSAIVSTSSAAGVDASMVLSMSATADDRVQLRSRYAAAWGLAEASARADAARDWTVRAAELIERIPRDDELDQVTAAADLAELNREAVNIWRGESPTTPPGAGSAGGYTSASNKIPPNTPPGVALPGAITGAAADGAWGERYLAAERNIPVRLERLAELDRDGGPIGWVDAGVLVEAACFASPVQVRIAAQRLVARFSDEPAIVSAVLDVLPNAPRIKSVSDMIARIGLASLPRPTDADWELLARRALVERFLSMMADDGIHGQIEQAAARIAAAYLDAAGEPPPGSTTDASAVGARRGAELLTEAAGREADGLPITRATRFDIEQIRRRATQRRGQAIGPIQAFGAEQAALAETLGFLVAAERPEREARVGEILDEMALSRRRARHVLSQIWAAERAMARLWLLRLAEEAPL